jgi:class 3 adenylate cyclase
MLKHCPILCLNLAMPCVTPIFLRLSQIETIGDSYVCVTGVPDPRGDHAVAMTRFAFECLKRFSRITKQLEPQLGPSTGDLQARVGMHSGVSSLVLG